MKVSLVASTIPQSTAGWEPAEKQWREQIESWPGVPGQFSFFVFKATTNFPVLEYASGVTCLETEDGCYIAGTGDEMALACLNHCQPEVPEEILTLYNYIHTKLSDFGYRTIGRKRPTLYGFTLENNR